MKINTNILKEINKQLQENYISPCYSDVIIERIDNDQYLWKQIRYAIDFAIGEELKSTK